MNGSQHHQTLQTIVPKLSVISLMLRYAAIGLVIARIVGLFAYSGGWLTPHDLTPARFIDRFEKVSGLHPGYFFITQQAVAQMRKQKSGHIVSIAAAVVDQPLAGAPISLPVITKSTIPAFSRALAMEFVADGILVNTISPGVVETPMHANDDHEQLKKLNPPGRLVQVSEIVDALLYLESAPMVNGENIRIDGGAHAGAKW
jgi:NAD(P)-dependent dehydrogenase (short-subunit alcohol dehydrogenase family)